MVLVILTYLAGALTIFSPCILPVLPFIFSKANHSFLKNGLPLLAGMCVTFSIFSALAIVGGEWILKANQIGRVLALILLSFFGLSLIFPKVSEKAMAPLARLGSKIGTHSNPNRVWDSFLIGVSSGLLWAPCAGPILGLVLTGAASQHQLSRSLLLLFSYSLGAATSLALTLIASHRLLKTLKKFLKFDQALKRGLGVLVLMGVAVITFNLDRTLLTQVSQFRTNSLEGKLLSFLGLEDHPTSQGQMPEIRGDESWINSKPLSRSDLLGKVVLIDFWTYSCINCLRTLPYLKNWAEKYKNNDFLIIGVHTPEFAFEKNLNYVKEAVQDLGILYPIVVDNNYRIWNAFSNRYWPAHYFVDRKGFIRNYHFGEGDYEHSEKIIRDLLMENGKAVQVKDVQLSATGVEAPALLDQSQSPETYLGYKRASNLVTSSPPRYDKPSNYKGVSQLKTHQWTLEGQWLINSEKIVLKEAHGKIRIRFHARDLHLVLGAEKKIPFQVTLDGQALGNDHGADTNSEGRGVVQSHRLYQLVRQQDQAPVKDHVFEIEFFDQGVEAFAFTFG